MDRNAAWCSIPHEGAATRSLSSQRGPPMGSGRRGRCVTLPCSSVSCCTAGDGGRLSPPPAQRGPAEGHGHALRGGPPSSGKLQLAARHGMVPIRPYPPRQSLRRRRHCQDRKCWQLGGKNILSIYGLSELEMSLRKKDQRRARRHALPLCFQRTGAADQSFVHWIVP